MARTVALALLIALAVACSTPAPVVVAPSPTTRSEATLRVLVTGTDGKAVSGARVCAAPTRGEDVCSEANVTGTATLTVTPATYFVRVSGPATGGLWRDEQRVADLAGGDQALWVELTQEHRLSGTVRDPDGKAVADAQACAHPASAADPTCARTQGDGTFAIDAPAGVYRVDVSGPPAGKLVGQWAVDRVFLEEANVYDARIADVRGIDVNLARGVVLRGTVRANGAPVENAQVCLKTLAAPLPWDCERTDKDGHYAALREPGRYWVWTVPPDDFRAVAIWYDDVLEGYQSSPFDLSTDRTLDVALRPAPTLPVLTGTVRTTSGLPVGGALVCVDTPFPTGRICRETGADGRYVIATRPETYIVSVIPPAHSGYLTEYYSQKRAWNTADFVNLGSSDVMLDLVLRPGTIVTGVVHTTSGLPVAGATINFMDEGGVLAATDTDIAGRFEVVVLPGHYHVQVFPSFSLGALLVERDLEVDAPRAPDLEVTLADTPLP